MSKTLPDISARLVASQALNSPNVNLSTIGTGSYSYAGTAGITVSMPDNTKIAKGKWVVINAPGAVVTISKNINYTDEALKSLTDIPQVVIIAKNILIADSVENVDSWLITTGTGTDGRINTCGAGGVTEATTISAGNCFRPLLMNGPIVANHLVMRRTGGAGPGTQAGNPAEVFNLRADAFIWSTSYSTGTGRIPTVSTKELPPRF